jgi:membrane-associated HD superfamily phosphohydrolase
MYWAALWVESHGPITKYLYNHKRRLLMPYRICPLVWFCCVIFSFMFNVLPTIVCPFVPFLLTIVLSVLRCMTSYYLFDIFKFFLLLHIIFKCTEAWKGHAEIFYLSRGHEILTRDQDILLRGHEATRC